MKNSDNLRTSRRSFTKTIAALASVPIVSSLVAAEVKTQNSIQESQNKSGSNRTHNQSKDTHDTPPPVEISDGSLRIDINEDLGPPTQADRRFIYQLAQKPH